MDMIIALVSDELKAVDFELGLCRFCHARVESNVVSDVEQHRDDCPWHGVRKELGLA